MVFGSGKKTRPLIAFVAEAPGETEAVEGVPLVGRSGQFLRKVMADVGIDEKEAYFTNTCLCHPVANKTPSATAVKACRKRLVYELARVKPQLVVALGRLSAAALAGHRSIKRSHGVYRQVTFLPGRPEEHTVGVVPTYHPAGVLRGPELFRDFVEELTYAKDILGGLEPVIEPPYDNYRWITTQKHFEWLALQLQTHPLVAVDIETDTMDLFTARILCVGFSWERESAYVLDWVNLIENNYANLDKLNKALKGVRLAFHNGIFDLPLLVQNGLTNAYYYLDTLSAHFLLDERQGTHDLERLAVKWYRAPDYKSQFRQTLGIKSYVQNQVFAERILQVDRDVLFEYNGADTDYTYRLAIDLSKEVKEEGQIDVLKDIEMPANRVFAEFRGVGMLIDRDYFEEKGQAWMKEENELVEWMREQVGDPEFNPNSTKQLAAYMYDVLELVPFGGREVLGKDKIDEDVIAAFIQTVDDPEAREYWTSRRTVMSSGMKGFGGDVKGISPRSTATYVLYWLRQQHEFPNKVIRWRWLRKRRSLYYDGIKGYMNRDGRVRPTYIIAATRTGRKASKDPAIHNIPRGDEIYDMFIAAPGWCLIHADYSQAEMRMMAHYSGDQALIGILNDYTKDIHTIKAMEIFKLTEEDVKNMPKAELSDKRIAAKMITFGLPYGRSAAGLAPQLGISVAEAQEYIDSYFAGVPELYQWLQRQRKRGVEEQVITSVFGRRRRFPLISDKYHRKEVERMAGNMAIQSAINDLTLLAYANSLIEVRRAGIPILPGPHIHDSINYSVPIPFWKQAVEIIMATMVQIPFESEVEFPGTCEVGERWGGMITIHDKGKWIEPDLEKDIPAWIRLAFGKKGR